MDDPRPSVADVEAALDQHAERLLAYPNVTGVGIQEAILPDGTTEPRLHVYVTRKLAPDRLAASAKIPDRLTVTIEDATPERPRRLVLKVHVQEIGAVRPESPSQAVAAPNAPTVDSAGCGRVAM
jgi:hypothetical protein